jgi:hypothetical protein
MRPLLLLVAFIALVAVAGFSCLTQPGRPDPGPGSGDGADGGIVDVPRG